MSDCNSIEECPRLKRLRQEYADSLREVERLKEEQRVLVTQALMGCTEAEAKRILNPPPSPFD